MISHVKIPIPDNFSFKNCLNFLNRGYDECLYTADKQSVKRLIRLSSGLAMIEVSADKDNVIISINKTSINKTSINKSKVNTGDEQECQKYVMDWFDLDRDIAPFYQLLQNHRQTKNFPEKYHGLRLMGIVDLFEAMCWCVIGQQINLTFAHKIKSRLVHRFGAKITHDGQTHYCFPSPEDLLDVDREELVAMQFSKQKINYILNISAAFCSDEINKTALMGLDKPAQMDKMLAIKGIGPWTANYVSMKSLRDMTCIAYGDTGLSSALHTHFDTDKKPDNDTINEIFKPFAGWESYLNFYLWRSLN